MPPKAPADRPPTSRLPKFEPPDHRACNSLTPFRCPHALHPCPSVDSGFNLGGYANPEFDKVADAFLAEGELDAARDQAYALQAFIADDVPVVTLFNLPIFEAYRSDTVQWSFTNTLNGVQSAFQNINGPLSYTRIK